MTDRELAEIRKTLTPERHAVDAVHGCYVNAEGTVIARFKRSFGLMTDGEDERYLSVFRRVLGGTYFKHLLDIDFSTSQISGSAEYALLSSLRESRLEDEGALDPFYSKIIASSGIKSNFVILLAHNSYDIPFRGADGNIDPDRGGEVYSYIVCAVCPVKISRPELAYDSAEKLFLNVSGEGVIARPDFGFLFPAFEDRSADIGRALFYTRSGDDIHGELLNALFGHAKRPLAASVQNSGFKSLLERSLGDDCSFEVAKHFNSRIAETVEEHKQSRSPERLSVSKGFITDMLEECGVPEEKISSFAAGYDETFGASCDLAPRNIANIKKLSVETANIRVTVSPGKSDLLETRVIDGVKYILIRADSSVVVDGVETVFEKGK